VLLEQTCPTALMFVWPGPRTQRESFCLGGEGRKGGRRSVPDFAGDRGKTEVNRQRRRWRSRRFTGRRDAGFHQKTRAGSRPLPPSSWGGYKPEGKPEKVPSGIPYVIGVAWTPTGGISWPATRPQASGAWQRRFPGSLCGLHLHRTPPLGRRSRVRGAVWLMRCKRAKRIFTVSS